MDQKMFLALFRVLSYHDLISFILTIALHRRQGYYQCCHSHFIDENTEAQRHEVSDSWSPSD